VGAFIALKLGIFLFKVVISDVIAARNIENIECPYLGTNMVFQTKKT